MLQQGTPWIAALFGFFAAQVGAFGHNWVHQPKYKWMAYLSLDLVGFSSDQWYRAHLLQHHMYTNTPWDNHFKGMRWYQLLHAQLPSFLQLSLSRALSLSLSLSHTLSHTSSYAASAFLRWRPQFHAVEGTDPFLIADSTVPRSWLQANVMPYINPLLLTVGLPGNYLAHLKFLLRGQEVITGRWKVHRDLPS